MDLFAVILVTLTLLTLCGICVFISICTLHTKILRYFHRKAHRTYHLTAVNTINDIYNDIPLDSLDLVGHSSLNDLGRRTYLKILERSVRTGRRIQDEQIYEMQTSDLQSNLFYYLTHYAKENMSSTSTNSSRTIEI